MNKTINTIAKNMITNQNEPVVPSMCLSTIFSMNEPFADNTFQYSRVGNPTRTVLEKTLANLEKARFCSVFSSGSSALATFLLTLRPKDVVLCHFTMYEGTQRLFNTIGKQFDFHCHPIDMSKTDSIAKHITQNVKWIFFESPTNPLLEVLDISSICAIAHNQSIRVAIDNTLASPVIQKPLTLGADLVIESITKAINGHSDVVGGLIATNHIELHKTISWLQQTMGAVLSPFDCFLTLRGIKTLAIRTQEQQRTAKKVVNFLMNHKHVERVHFPGLQSRSEQRLVRKQMSNQGSILSFRLKKTVNPSIFLKKLTCIRIAQSFGGVETVIQQPTTMMTLSQSSSTNRIPIDNRFFRLSIGLECADDICVDLQNALQ